MGLDIIIRHAHKPTDLISALDLFLIKRPDDYREPGWHPSDFAFECPRFLVIRKLLNHKKVFAPKIKRIFDLGKVIHSMMQNDYFGRMGILWGRWLDLISEEIVWGFKPDDFYRGQKRIWIYDEVPIKIKLDGFDSYVVGQADGLLVIDKNSILEVKSTNDWNFKSTKYPNKKHIGQANLYGYGIKNGFVRDCPIKVPIPSDIDFVYYNKNTSIPKQLTVPITDIGDRELQKLIYVESCLRDRKLPNNCEDCSNINCEKSKKCDLSSYCYGNKSFDELEELGKNNK